MGWEIKVRPGKRRTNDARNLLLALTKTNSWRETFCRFLGWDCASSKKKKKMPVMLNVLKLLSRGYFEAWQWESN